MILRVLRFGSSGGGRGPLNEARGSLNVSSTRSVRAIESKSGSINDLSKDEPNDLHSIAMTDAPPQIGL